MNTEAWKLTLEAYLDGELSQKQARDFEKLAASDPTVEAELATRRSLRAAWRGALLAPGEAQATRPIGIPSGRFRRKSMRWLPPALAASLALLLAIPLLDRSEHVQNENITPALTRSGQVVAPSFGEIPGRIVVLEPGAIDLPSGWIR